MPSIGASELVLILVIAFVVVGPKDLPKVARYLARAWKSLRRMIDEVKKETGFDEVEADLKDIGKEMQATKDSMDIRKDLQETTLEVNKQLGDIHKELSFKDYKQQLGGKKP